ncbi:MAG: ROK family protein, partial [Oscillospiraceae bacterium]|nr:ROK family protein [Oscillospiraceae bacterium]
PVTGCDISCGCGNRGCMEAFAGGKALARIQQEHFSETPIGDLFTRHGKDQILLCFIDGMAERYRKAIGEDAAVVVTGGLAPVILPYCSGKYDYDEFLLPEGLKLICNRTYNRTK